MEGGMDGRDIVRVLLVGGSPQSFSVSRQLLERSGCECHFAGSLEAAKELLHLWQFDVVLSTQAVPGDTTIQGLVGLLSRSGISLFSSLRVEEGSWWLPVLQFGNESHGPAVRAGDFAHFLDDLSEQIRLQRYALQGFGDPKHGKH
jgi:CheY-like chemotaxis protein